MKWVGRGIGAFYVAFFLLFFVAHLFGDEPPSDQPLTGREIGCSSPSV